jgi:hypothetical protein
MSVLVEGVAQLPIKRHAKGNKSRDFVSSINFELKILAPDFCERAISFEAGQRLVEH